MKSKIRIISFAALLLLFAGIAYLFSTFPYEPDKALLWAGFLLAFYVVYVATYMICENCGKSMKSEVMRLPGLPGTEEFIMARKRLFKSGYHLFPFKKHCPFCGVERY